MKDQIKVIENVNRKLLEHFSIPHELKNDITYCQIFLRHYIKVHQLWTLHIKQNANDLTAKKCLEDLVNDIREIDSDQKKLISQLRNYAYTFYKKAISKDDQFDLLKEVGEGIISKQLYNALIYVKYCQNSSVKVLSPINIKERKLPEVLLSSFILKIDDSRPVSKSSSISTVSTISSNNSSKLKNNKQVSLLKPKEERINLLVNKSDNENLTKDIDEPVLKKPLSTPNVPTAINNSRLNLLNALNKARTQRLETTTTSTPNQAIKSSKSDSSSPISLPSSVDSSPAVSEASFENIIPSAESPIPFEDEDILTDTTEITQEGFLRIFGLCTHDKSIEIRSKRRERRRRNVTSTEKLDFHYGRFDLYDPRPHNLKRKKPILYSPPATRALKKRKCNEYNADILSKLAANNLQVNEKICNTCYGPVAKNGERLNKCEKCHQSFHIKCHKNMFSTQSLRSRENVCPICYRQQQKAASAAYSQIRDIKQCERLKRKNLILKSKNQYLITDFKNVDKVFQHKKDEIENLINHEITIREKIRNMFNFIKQFKGFDCV